MSKIVGEIGKYKCTVSKDILKIAENELREDDNIREQSLEIFRNWILQNNDILTCRLDSIYLLRFLRNQKFSIPLAQDIFMKHLTTRSIYPEYYENTDVLGPDVKEIFEKGIYLVLQERLDNGRRVVIYNPGNQDNIAAGITPIGRAWAIIVDTFLENEDNQVTGLTLINYIKGCTLDHLSIYSLSNVQRYVAGCFKFCVLRINAIHAIALPPYFEIIGTLFKKLLSPKLSDRLTIHGSKTTFEDLIPKRMIPKEFGGDGSTIHEITRAWIKEMEQVRPKLKLLSQIKIAESYKIQRLKDTFKDDNLGVEGSFRKLQID